ncbi:proton-translocating transhydrogenase family protein [Cyclobacteriaceae bacterium]|nr:proton-translocating transhydrogenase family protein [Cyclobacteriaceae bacterium]
MYDVVIIGGGIVGLAILLGTINVVGGHAVTNRMLQMFRKK